jgi:uncharacterized protein
MEAINEFIVKISSRCNLNCTYCYEYNLGDDSWKSMEKKISISTIQQLNNRIIKHCEKYEINDIVISLHGGEPLLVGSILLEEIILEFKKLENFNIFPLITLQTNGTLIDEEILTIFLNHSIYISTSIDGDLNHNYNRIYHNNKNSFIGALTGINLIRDKIPTLFLGVLTVIDIMNDPTEIYNFYKKNRFQNFDFILPDYSWQNKPPRPDVLNWMPNKTDADDLIIYGLWYAKIWDLWVNDKDDPPKIRFFENILHNIVTGNGIFELMNNDPATLITINTNGGYEGVDTLKSLGTGYQKLNMNIFDHDLESVMEHPKYKLRQNPKEQYSDKCLNCINLTTCWGGYFPHRIDGNIIKESIYCNDLYYLINHIKYFLNKKKVI